MGSNPTLSAIHKKRRRLLVGRPSFYFLAGQIYGEFKEGELCLLQLTAPLFGGKPINEKTDSSPSQNGRKVNDDHFPQGNIDHIGKKRGDPSGDTQSIEDHVYGVVLMSCPMQKAKNGSYQCQ